MDWYESIFTCKWRKCCQSKPNSRYSMNRPMDRSRQCIFHVYHFQFRWHSHSLPIPTNMSCTMPATYWWTVHWIKRPVFLLLRPGHWSRPKCRDCNLKLTENENVKKISRRVGTRVCIYSWAMPAFLTADETALIAVWMQFSSCDKSPVAPLNLRCSAKTKRVNVIAFESNGAPCCDIVDLQTIQKWNEKRIE